MIDLRQQVAPFAFATAISLAGTLALAFAMSIIILTFQLQVEEDYALFAVLEEVFKIALFLIISRRAIPACLGFGFAEFLHRLFSVFLDHLTIYDTIWSITFIVPALIMHGLTGVILYFTNRRYHYFFAIIPMLILHYSFNEFIDYSNDFFDPA